MGLAYRTFIHTVTHSVVKSKLGGKTIKIITKEQSNELYNKNMTINLRIKLVTFHADYYIVKDNI